MAQSSVTVRSDVDVHFRVTAGPLLSQEQLAQCAELFSKNYGIWAPHCEEINPFFKPGGRVKMSPSKLRTEVCPDPEHSVLVTCTIGGRLIGHAFATSWHCGQDVVGWVTQLVVEKTHRRRYIATTLLQTLKAHEWSSKLTVFGLASSHPAAVNALVKFSSLPMSELDIDFIGHKARAVVESATVRYIKNAELRGSLFGDKSDEGAVSSVFTNFPVDHAEPQQVLESYLGRGVWKLGRPLRNHEFIVMIPVVQGHGVC